MSNARYLKFGPEDKERAKKFIGTVGWYYNNPALVATFEATHKPEFSELSASQTLAEVLNNERPYVALFFKEHPKFSEDCSNFNYFVCLNPEYQEAS